MMMLYKILNVGTGRYFALDSGRKEDGTLIISWASNDFEGQHKQFLWQLDCQDRVLQHYTVMNFMSKTYASTPQVHEGADVVGSRFEQPLEFLDVKEGIFKIKVLKSTLVLAFSNSADGTHAKLQPIKNGDPQQEWKLVRYHE